MLKAAGCFGSPVEVSRSILAGCRFSVGFARCVMYSVLDKAQHRRQSRIMRTIFRLYVDDLSQNTRGMKKDEVVVAAADASLSVERLCDADMQPLSLSEFARQYCVRVGDRLCEPKESRTDARQ